MKEIKTTAFENEIKDCKPRDCLAKIVEFIDGDSYIDGNILCLCGLEGTGKRTLMKQALVACKFKNEECLFLEGEERDELWETDSLLKEASEERGIKVVFIDEITRTDFVDDADELCVAAIDYKLRIVVAGNNPCAMYFANRSIYKKYDHMYDAEPWNEIAWHEKLKYLSVESMTYAEYCRCFGKTSIDDYAVHGGLMDKKASSYYYSLEKYMENCVAEKIVEHGEMSRSVSCDLGKDAVRAVEKICALLCGDVETTEYYDILCKEFKITVPSYEYFVDGSSMERITILEPFVKILNASFPRGSGASALFVREVLCDLETVGFLSGLKNTVFVKSSDGNWNPRKEHEYHVTQNVIRYRYLKNCDHESWHDWRISEKLDEVIKAEIIKKTVFFDTYNKLGYENYAFSKISFRGRSFDMDIHDCESSTIDMVVYDEKQKRHWAFLVTFGKIESDKKILLDKEFTEAVEKAYGARAGNYVIHSGENSVSEEGIVFINTEEFLLKLDELKDMEKVVNYFEEEQHGTKNKRKTSRN